MTNEIELSISCLNNHTLCAIKNGTEKEISPNFCHCSTGFIKPYWDIIFDQPTKVEPIETLLAGKLECKLTLDPLN